MAQPKPTTLRKVAILGGVRIPFTRSGTDYKDKANMDLMGRTLNALVDQYKLAGETLGEVALGAVINHTKDWNLARECVLSTELSPATPAFNVQRACATSLETTVLLANKIALGQLDSAIAGGSDTNSDVPLGFSQPFSRRLVQSSRARSVTELPNVWKGIRVKDLKPAIPAVTEPRTGLSMGEHCELMAQEWQISRADQDELALASHQRAVEAYEKGFYDDLVAPYQGLKRDNNLRPDTTIEKLGKLKNAFEKSEKGTMTAGNSTPLTDGASAVLLASEDWAKAHNIPIQAYFETAQSAAVDFVGGDGLLMAPTLAVAQLLNRVGMALQDFDLYEIHEAFAAQALCTLKAWESPDYCKEVLGLDTALGAIDRDKMNICGGSVGIGHPFGATGGRLVATLSKNLAGKPDATGLISVCTGGGMGVAAVFTGA